MTEHRSGFGGMVVQGATPRPWHVRVVNVSGYDRIEVCTAAGQRICIVDHDGGNAEGSEGWFNAQKICAASNPDGGGK